MNRTPILRPSDQRRLLTKLEISASGCFEWIGPTTKDGYGIFSLFFVGDAKHQPIGAHRAAYWLFVGDIPDGQEVDHKCRNRACCNPDHLTLISDPDHRKQAGSRWLKRTHCSQGHPLTPDNLYPRYSNPGRRCKICARARSKAWEQAHQAERNAQRRERRSR